MKKSIVTGGCGFIGYNLTKELVKQGHQVTVIDDLSTGYSDNYVPGANYIYKSILDRKVLNKFVSKIEPQCIFHLAAIPRVSYSVEYPFETAEANVLGSIAVFDAARKVGARVIASSSSSVYGGADILPTPETHPCNPKSPYALDKWQMEQWGKMYASVYNLDCVFLRYFNVFGPHSRFGGAYSTVLSAWLYALFVDQSVQPFLEGDGTQTRDFCFIDNVVQANIKVAECDDKFEGDVFNVAQGLSHSLNDVKSIIENLFDVALDLEQRPPRKGDVKHTLADISNAGACFGYRPSVDFENQILAMAEWYKNSYPNE